MRDGSQDVILIIASDYPEAFRKGEPAPVQVIIDSSRQSASASMQRVRSLLNEYSGMLGMLRLQARGVNPALLTAVAIGVRDLATPQSQALIFLNMMPFFITLSIFSGGMFVIIDATAGERERGSLEPLFINPVNRWEFVIGKLSASLPFALVSLALVLFIFWAGFSIVPVEDFIGFPMVLDGQSLMAIYLLCLPEILLAAALQMLIATYTRSFKEAQTYLSFMPIVIALPAVFLSFTSVQSTLAFMSIPTYGQSLLINQILRRAVNPHHLLGGGQCGHYRPGAVPHFHRHAPLPARAGAFRQDLIPLYTFARLAAQPPRGGFFQFDDYIIAAWISL